MTAGHDPHAHQAHQHAHATPGAGVRYLGRLTVAFVVILVFFVVQVIVAIATGSLALLSDAGHMLTDALGLGLALAAITARSRAVARSGAAPTASTASRCWPRS